MALGNPSGSRTGDLLLLMDTRAGAFCAHEGDILPAWHGGPTAAESQVPMVWFFASAKGTAMDDPDHSDLLGIVKQEVEAAKTARDPARLYSRDFKAILSGVLDAVKP